MNMNIETLAKLLEKMDFYHPFNPMLCAIHSHGSKFAKVKNIFQFCNPYKEPFIR